MTVELLTEAEAAQLLRVHRSTLSHWRRAGKGPRWQPIGERHVGYHSAEIEQWLTEQRTSRPTPTPEARPAVTSGPAGLPRGVGAGRDTQTP